MKKAELRKIYLGKQAALSDLERAEASRQITDRFFSGFDLERLKHLHCFISIEKFKEVRTGDILRRVWSDFPNIVTVVPRVNFETAVVESVAIGPDSGFAANAWDIREPIEGDIVRASALDIVLVPGIAFDRAFHRVGYGKGFYDRFLSQCRTDCKKVGLSYFPPVVSIDDIAEHDVQLHHIITPGAILSAKS